MSSNKQPIGKSFTILTKRYFGFLANKLADLPIDRYFYPLLVISQNDGQISQYQLAEILDLDKVTIFRIVDHLEKNELIVRCINPEDRRCQLLHLTESAHEIVPKIEQAINEIDAVLLSQLNPDIRDKFEDALMDIINNTNEMPLDRIDINFDNLREK